MDTNAPAQSIPDTATPEEIFERAAVRAREHGLCYAGEVTPAEAHRLVRQGAASIVDVRTRAEWEYVGRIDGSRLVEWRAFGANSPNPDFVAGVAALHAPDDAVLLLCRSGVRSHHAAEALAKAGFRRAYNILEGFEGDRDARGHRSTVGGWRFAGLPWTQG
jgi:rhodanese-related sulfurtransferase